MRQVRSDSSAKKVLQTHAKYKDQLSFVIVKDITVPGAFDDAVQGVDGVRNLYGYMKDLN
jgi:hypothetical protein